MKSWLLRIILKLLLTFLSLVLALLLVELYLHILGYQKKTFIWGWANELTADSTPQRIFSLDRDLIYAPNANVINPHDPQDPVISDQLGFRPTSQKIASEETKTVVVIGDSFTWGYLLTHDQTYPYFLEQELRSRNIPVNVINGGVNGYGTDQQFIYLRDRILKKVKPDVVVWNMNLNDVEDNNYACLFVPTATGFHQVSALRNTSYLQGVIAKQLPSLVRNTSLANLALYQLAPEWDRQTLGCERNTTPDTFLSETQRAKLKYFFSEMNAISQQQDFELIVTLMPNQFYLDPSYQNDESWIQLERELSALLQQATPSFISLNYEAAPLLDSYPSFLAARAEIDASTQVLGVATASASPLSLADFFIDEGEAARGHWHLTPAANRSIAKLVADQLEHLFN